MKQKPSQQTHICIHNSQGKSSKYGLDKILFLFLCNKQTVKLFQAACTITLPTVDRCPPGAGQRGPHLAAAGGAVPSVLPLQRRPALHTVILLPPVRQHGVPLSGHPERHGQPSDGFPRLLPPLPPPLRGTGPRRHRLSAVRLHPRHRG